MKLVKVNKHNFSFEPFLEKMYRLWVNPKQQPYFKCYSKQIEILESPIDFYINLHKGIR